jgi:cytoskeletal protein RodZ
MSIGILLRQARESAGLSIDDVAKRTNIRGRVLQDLEAENFTSSGGNAYARGHIRSIARVIKANPDLLIEEFNQTVGEEDRSMFDLLQENNVTQVKREKKNISYKTLAYSAAAIIALVVLVPTGISFIHTSHSVKKAAPVASQAAVVAPNTAVATKTSATSVVVTAVNGKTWVGVTDSNGNQIFSGQISQGQTQSFNDSQQLNVVVGNAGAVNLNVNGKDAGSPGALGEVVHLQFGPGSSSQG